MECGDSCVSQRRSAGVPSGSKGVRTDSLRPVAPAGRVIIFVFAGKKQSRLDALFYGI